LDGWWWASDSPRPAGGRAHGALVGGRKSGGGIFAAASDWVLGTRDPIIGIAVGVLAAPAVTVLVADGASHGVVHGALVPESGKLVGSEETDDGAGLDMESMVDVVGVA
jgi:hypothetical protein